MKFSRPISIRSMIVFSSAISFFPTLAFSLIVALLQSGCAEPAGSGVAVSIPSVQINCVTTRCRAAATARAFIVYTTSGCVNSSFGETVAGSATLTCNGTSCQATISSFTNRSGSSETSIREGFYSVCAVIDFNNDYIGTAVAGQDSTGTLGDSFVTTGSATKTVSAFLDI